MSVKSTISSAFSAIHVFCLFFFFGFSSSSSSSSRGISESDSFKISSMLFCLFPIVNVEISVVALDCRSLSRFF
uniref:Uncharacterized protein n=1 Tax=Panstrongylus lignarius TaxID=156445 RepID=A0A224Y4A5_9HEMI